MNFAKVDEALIKLEPGLFKYWNIMERFHKTDVTKDLDFQKRFNGFYRVRQRKPEFYMEYYDFLEKHKDKEVSFDLVLKHFYDLFERIEASFSSKMVATINPNLPVWDKYILDYMGLKKPVYGAKDRINKTIDIYNEIIKWYEDFLLTEDARKMIELFDDRYKGAGITDIKKIDLILWQIR